MHWVRPPASLFSSIPLTLFVVTLFAHPAVATEARPRYFLRQQAQNGEAWTFEQTYDMQIDSTITSDGNPAEQTTQHMHQVRSGTITVLSAGENGIDGMRINFDGACATTIEQTGQLKHEVQFSLAGMTIVVRRRPSGEIVNDFKGELDAQTQNELAAMLEPESRLFPQQPVTMGEEWAVRKAGLERHFQLKATDQGSGTCSLDSTKMDEGRPVADMIIAIDLVKLEQGFIKTEIKLKGAARIDLSSGHTTAGVLDGPLVLSGSQIVEQKGRPVTVKVSGQGKMSFRSATKWLAAAAPVANAGKVIDADAQHAASVQAPHTPQSTGLVAAGGAGAHLRAHPVIPRGDLTGTDPANDAPAAETFNGLFRDDTLRVDLTAAGPDVTGTIRLAGQRFPLRGKIEADTKLQGTFENEGTTFNFTATFDGPVLVLVTENTPYRLRRQKINPLARTE